MTRPTVAPTGPPATGSVDIPQKTLVVLGGHVPDWLRAWCRETGRRLDTRPDVEFAAAAPLIAGGGPPDPDLAGRTVWIARALPDRAPRRIVAAIRRLPDDADVLDEAIEATAYLDASLTIAHAVPLSFAERSVGLDAAVADGHRVLMAATDAARSRLPGPRVGHALVRSHPHELVGETLDADLLVLGGLGVDLRGEPGVVRRSALHHAPCPVLLVPRSRRG